MPTYEHICNECKHEWEEVYGMNDQVPNICPKCKTTGKVKRLISWCSGNVVLTGRENVQKQWEEGKKIARQMKHSENIAANIIGEDKFEKTTNTIDKLKSELK